jgi:hypothetical protein
MEPTMQTMLDEAVPAPPAALADAPLAAIRRRRHRRQAGMAAGVATLLAVIVVGADATVRLTGRTEAPPARNAPAETDRMIVGLRLDGRTLDVSVPADAHGAPCDRPAPPARATSRADQVILTEVPSRTCAYQVTVALPAPLAGRPVYDGPDGALVSLLPQRLLPRPAYPTGLRRDPGVLRGVNAARRPIWAEQYKNGPGGMVITIAAIRSPEAGNVGVGERQVSGHTLRLVRHPNGSQEIATWAEGDWYFQLFAHVDRVSATSVTPAQFDRILDGLVWPK